MDERFGTWLRDAMADIDEDMLKKRWSAVESLSSELNDSEILGLILYCAIGRTHSTETLQKVKSAFWTHDNAFKMEGNDLELRRLCGAVVIHMLADEPERELDFALTIACLHFGGLGNDFGLPAMADEAEKILQRLAVDTCSSDATSEIPKRTITTDKFLEKISEKIEEEQRQLDVLDLKPLFIEHLKIQDWLTSQNRSIRRALEIQKEENDILWWLTGASSNDLQQQFSNFDRTFAAVIAGKELADHVTRRPGPLGASSILGRMILNSTGDTGAVSLRAVVTKIPMDWRKQLVPGINNFALDYCPLLASIWHSVELDDDPNWVTPFSKRFSYSTEQEISQSVLAYQMYREWMLALNLTTWE